MMLTAKGDEIDKVVGLEVGADDYVAKPFGRRELLARVRALMRRADYPSSSEERPVQETTGEAPRPGRELVAVPCASTLLGGAFSAGGKRWNCSPNNLTC